MSEINKENTLSNLIPSGLTYPQMKEFLAQHDDIKFDPVFAAMVNGMGEAITSMAEQAAKEGAEDIHEVMSYHRQGYTFNSSEVQESIEGLAIAMIVMRDFKALSEEERTGDTIDRKKILKSLNCITDVSDALINVGMHNPGTQPENLGPENISSYFGALKVHQSFVDTFLKPMGITVVLRPVFADADVPEEFKLVKQPFFVLKEGTPEEVEVVAAPCATYMPDWYIVMNKFRTVAMANLEDARIAVEDADTTAIDDVSDEAWAKAPQ